MREFKLKLFQDIGEVVYRSQLLEDRLSQLLFFLENNKSPDDVNLDREFEKSKASKKTLGVLMREFEKNNDTFILENKHRKIFQECINARNYIVHGLLKDEKLDIQTKLGRKNLMLELGKQKDIVTKGQILVEGMFEELIEGLGGDINKVKKEVLKEFE